MNIGKTKKITVVPEPILAPVFKPLPKSVPVPVRRKKGGEI